MCACAWPLQFILIKIETISHFSHLSVSPCPPSLPSPPSLCPPSLPSPLPSLLPSLPSLPPSPRRMLLRRGANPSIEDSNKCDPAFLARKAGFHECRQILTHHIKNRFSILATQTENVSMYVSMSAEHALEVCFCMCGISMTLYVYSVHVHVYIRTPWM